MVGRPSPAYVLYIGFAAARFNADNEGRIVANPELRAGLSEEAVCSKNIGVVEQNGHSPELFDVVTTVTVVLFNSEHPAAL